MQAEYRTEFELPKGSYISNYYLVVKDIKKYGLIADKRAAEWVYNQIVDERKDPGILSYTADNKVNFRVFPFGVNETRKTGFEVLHRGPLTLKLGNTEIPVTATPQPKQGLQADFTDINNEILYVTASAKLGLSKVTRPDRYVFIVDCSKTGNIDVLTKRMHSFIQKQQIPLSAVSVVAANDSSFEVGRSSKLDYSVPLTLHASHTSGFLLENAVKKVLYKNYVGHEDERPVFIAVTDNIYSSILPQGFGNCQFMLPDNKQIYFLAEEGALQGFDFMSGKYAATVNAGEKIPSYPVYKYAGDNGSKAFNVYLPDDGQDSILLLDDKSTPLENLNALSPWQQGIVMDARFMNLALHPENTYNTSLDIVKYSIRNKLMSRLTAFMVLENEAQEKALLKKQEQILSSKMNLDAGEPERMSEPEIWIALLVIAAILLLKRRKQKSRVC